MRSPPERSETLWSCFPGGFAMMSMPLFERVVFIEQREVGATAAEEFGEHLAEVDSHLREGFREKLLRRLVDPRDHVEQFAARVGQVGVLRFEESVALLEFVVFVDGVEIHRAHRVELAGEFGDDRAHLRLVDLLARGGFATF